MILLLSTTHRNLLALRERVARPDLIGRLVDPHDTLTVADTVAAGIPVAADNLAFTSRFTDRGYRRMLDDLAGLPVLWVSVPDVVGDAEATNALWARWAPEVLDRGLPLAYVAQDGLRAPEVPSEARCVFIGGTDAFKLGPGGRSAAAEARRRGLLLHVGRVNSVRRIAYAGRLGAHSIDGSGWSRFTDDKLRQGMGALSAWWLL